MGSNRGVNSSGLSEEITERLKTHVRIDTRSLAVFRVLIGSLVIADIFLRSRNFSFFYTESGVVPQWLATAMTTDNAFSVYYFTTDPYVIAALFIVQILIAIQLIIGWETRIATILTFLLVVSLDHHNPLVLSYADIVFRLLLFWAIFLPLEERWSVDAVHRNREPREYVASVASALILVQLVYMYFVNGIHKSRSELWTGGDATVLIFGLDNTTFLLGEFMRNFPTLLRYGGLLWYYMLLFSWLLLVLRGRKRTLLVALFVGGHAAFAVTVRIGAFPYIPIAGLMLFLQAQFWNDAKALSRYVADDGLRFDAARAKLNRFGSRFPTLQPRGNTRERAEAVVHDFAVSFVAILFAVVVLSSLLQFGGVMDDPVGPEEGIQNSAAIIGVDQPEWSIFAPTPRSTDRYYVFPAETADGELIDVYNDRALTYERPHDELQKQFGTYRERFYMNSVRRGGFNNNDVPVVLAEHLCTEWREERGVEITHLNMYVLTEDVTLETIDSPEDRDRDASRFYEHGCGDNDPKEIAPPAI